MPLKGSIYVRLALLKSRDKYERQDMGRKKNEKAKLKGSCLFVTMQLPVLIFLQFQAKLRDVLC